jgi:hypothetical protein
VSRPVQSGNAGGDADTQTKTTKGHLLTQMNSSIENTKSRPQPSGFRRNNDGKRFTAIPGALAVLLVFATGMAWADSDNTPSIQGAVTTTIAPYQMTITGIHFGTATPPLVTLDGMVVNALSYTDTSITVAVPASLTPGSYALVVVANGHHEDPAISVATIGAVGPKGDKGDTGLTGATGAQGPIGATGATGLKGDNGLDGINGKDGINGAAGSNGKDGLNGLNGKDGLNGAPGAPGAKGDTGADGASGKSANVIQNGVPLSKPIIQTGDPTFNNGGPNTVTFSSPFTSKPTCSVVGYTLPGDVDAAYFWTPTTTSLTVQTKSTTGQNTLTWTCIGS